MGLKFLVVEDDADINELICYNLRKEGYEVRPVLRGDAVESAVIQFSPDLILLDLMLPGVDGLEVCRRLKRDARSKGIPVVMLTAKGSESDIVTGLQMGADDYITKPFSPKVLLARLRAVIRRSQPELAGDADRWTIGEMTIDLLKRKVVVMDRIIDLTTLEFDILVFLSRNPGRVFTREQLLDGVWKDGKFIIDRAVDVHVRSIRSKLGKADHLIETVRGIGYRFKDVEEI